MILSKQTIRDGLFPVGKIIPVRGGSDPNTFGDFSGTAWERLADAAAPPPTDAAITYNLWGRVA